LFPIPLMLPALANCQGEQPRSFKLNPEQSWMLNSYNCV